MCKFENIMDLNKNDFNNGLTYKTLCFTNKTRIEINKTIMNKKSGDYHKESIIRLKKLPP